MVVVLSAILAVASRSPTSLALAEASVASTMPRPGTGSAPSATTSTLQEEIAATDLAAISKGKILAVEALDLGLESLWTPLSRVNGNVPGKEVLSSSVHCHIASLGAET